MKLILISNYFNHHQRSLSDALYCLCDSFFFISTKEMREERKKLGYGETDISNYVLDNNDNTKKSILRMIKDADVVLLGGAPEKLVRKRTQMHKIIFRYSERPFKIEQKFPKKIFHWVKWKIEPPDKDNVYLLCSGGYVSFDFSKYGFFNKKIYKWGYFPKANQYDIDDLMNRKIGNILLWCGRFLDWKHPDDAIRIAQRLKADGYDFVLNMIGIGAMEESLHQMVCEYHLEDNVHFLGSMPPDRVREHMEKAGIYLFTSDRQEGWGAVLNESMNSGCAVVASHAIGAVPYLMKHNENGLIYKSGDIDALYQDVKYLLDHPEEQHRLGKAAYRTITEEWNAEIAAERFVNLAQHILDGEKYPDLYESGPCSKAEIIKDNWFNDADQTILE